MLLKHLSMRVEARVALLGDLLCQQFYAISGVAKDDRLVDLKLSIRSVSNSNDHEYVKRQLTFPNNVLRQ